MGWKKLVGVPYDIPVPGYGTNTVNFLRLWESRAPEEFNFEAFNRGGHEEAVREKNNNETISKVLYPNDKTDSAKSFASCSNTFSSPVRSKTSSAAFAGRTRT